ncbi:tetratricopeptide repeat protein [Paenibacillus sp. IB182496]|uniref:Tetratricopeptide repeat protein n=1 Tax=Paenibacillus sabuli TaxID=2772509 RepID=A0A927GT97_9BACL|nr:LuxR C-terminal-related transcriptional regulator [Paenibacillus sabuli]MBD2847589.1 tetratricopeptide repeat protein [Paenibacillus sabuli]
MSLTLLTTKLHIPPARPNAVLRSHLFRRLNEGQYRKLTLISAPAGYGKTTLASEWLAQSKRLTAWLSLDEGDNDPIRFLLHLIEAIKRVVKVSDHGIWEALPPQQPLPMTYILTALINELALTTDPFILVLDDYHVIESQSIHNTLSFLIDHQPLQLRLIIMTRGEPTLPIARLRAKNELMELRGRDLRFTRSESTLFFHQTMGLQLSSAEVSSLEARTEGWIAGLQLAAVSMQGYSDPAQFISSFTGSHRFVLDYLMEEVLKQQPDKVQTFLVQTSILERFCAPLCDAMLQSDGEGHDILAHLERSNLFIVPLDNERQWYRYHHLFTDMLRQRLDHVNKDTGDDREALHRRASHWFEENGLEIEAFQHAAAAQDVDRAAALIEGQGMPLHFRGAAKTVLDWLQRQEESTLDERPSLWVSYASALLMLSQLDGIEQKLSAAEAAMSHIEPREADRDLIGHIASIRATLGVIRHDADTIMTQSRIALEHLHPLNLPVRAATTWTLGVACQLQGDRAAARRAYSEAISISQSIGHHMITLMASLGLGEIQASDNQLSQAAQTYQQVLQLAGEPPLPVACDAYLGMARIAYERNDLDAAEQHIQRSMRLAKQIDNTDRLVDSECFAAKLKLARHDVTAAEALLTKVRHEMPAHPYNRLQGELIHQELMIALHRDNFGEMVTHMVTSGYPMLQARIHIIQGNGRAAIAMLGTLHDQARAKQWKNVELKLLILQALAFQALGNMERALQRLNEALVKAKTEGFVRLFVEEGKSMLDLLTAAAARRMQPEYTEFLLTHMQHEQKLLDFAAQGVTNRIAPLVESLSERELEILNLIAQGCSNQEISERLFLALSTVKGYNRNIFDKLQVKRRTEAIARARELGII